VYEEAFAPSNVDPLLLPVTICSSLIAAAPSAMRHVCCYSRSSSVTRKAFRRRPCSDLTVGVHGVPSQCLAHVELVVRICGSQPPVTTNRQGPTDEGGPTSSSVKRNGT
jgi:hypothetical protein